MEKDRKTERQKDRNESDNRHGKEIRVKNVPLKV
jgi:hypothetical protein